MGNGFFDQHGTWIPQAERNPLDGPFMSSKQLTGYSDEPGYAIRLPDAPAERRIVPRYFDAALAAVAEHFGDLGPAASHRRAWGIAQDYESAVLDGRSGGIDAYVAQLAEWAGH
jgi:hypothetical protein